MGGAVLKYQYRLRAQAFFRWVKMFSRSLEAFRVEDSKYRVKRCAAWCALRFRQQAAKKAMANAIWTWGRSVGCRKI